MRAASGKRHRGGTLQWVHALEGDRVLRKVRETYTVKGSEIGDFGGSSLEPPRRSEAVAGRPVAGPRCGSTGLPRAARRALRSRSRRAVALPRETLGARCETATLGARASRWSPHRAGEVVAHLCKGGG